MDNTKEPFIHSTSIVDEGAQIGEGTKIWHFSHIASRAQIGKDCTLGQNVFVAARVRIGNHVKIQNNVSIYEGVELEDEVFCGPSCVFTNVKTPRSEFPRNTANDYRTTKVERGATIGANATVVCGITIGRYALIGAGAVVARNVPPYAVMAGVPARRVGWACECGIPLGKFLQCQECKRAYELVSEIELRKKT